MRLRGAGSARRVLRWTRRQLKPGPVILGYHRVANVAWDPQRLCVSPNNFAEQIEVLQARAQLIPLGELVEALASKRRLDGAVVVTFDDGYEDSLHAAVPILRRFGAPAHVFISTGLVGQRYWWCDVEELVAECAEFPLAFSLSIGEQEISWKSDSDTIAARARLVAAIGDWFRKLPVGLQSDAMDKLRGLLGGAKDGGSSVRAMTDEEVRKLASEDSIEIGSHLVTHTSMDQLDVETQKRELRDSRGILETLTGRPVDTFAYPNGKMSVGAPAIAKELGYRAGIACVPDAVPMGCNPYRLPRVWPGDWGGDRFMRWLRWWL